jgi:hypothetical protein
MLKTLILPILLVFHPVHVTLTSINQAQGSDSLKVFFRMYYDDFLRDYKLYDPGCNIDKISDSQTFPADLMNKYFNDKVNIYVNGKLLAGRLLNMNIFNNEICTNLFYRSDINPKKIKIRNLVLIRMYSDQANMIYISVNKNEEGILLTPEHFKEVISLKQ